MKMVSLRLNRTLVTRSLIAVSLGLGAVIAACSSSDDTATPTTPDTTPDGSTTQGDATVASDTGSVVADTGPQGDAGCTSNSQCPGDYRVCKKSTGQCISLVVPPGADGGGPNCYDVVAGDYKNDDAILFGELARLDGRGPAVFTPIEFAAGEMNTAVGGIPDSTGKKHPLAIVKCSFAADLIGSATYLTSTVGVPAIIGPGNSGQTVTVANAVTINANVLLMPPVGTSPTLGTLNANDLLWMPSPSDAAQGAILSAMVPDLEAKIRLANGSQPIKVFIANKSDAYGTALLQIMEQTLTINGHNVLDAANANYFQTAQYDMPATVATWDPATIVSQIIAFKPDIIMTLGTYEGGIIVEKVENIWPAGTTRPQYIFPDGMATNQQVALQQIPSSYDLRSRARGTVPGNTDRANYKSFVARFTAVPANAGLSDPGGANAYDGTYALMYAAAAAGGVNLTGPKLAAAMRTVTDPTGTAINVGPDDLAAGFAVAAAGNKVHLSGAGSSLEFDAQHFVHSDYVVWCIGKDSSGNFVSEPSGQIFSYSDNAFQGTFNGCPDTTDGGTPTDASDDGG